MLSKSKKPPQNVKPVSPQELYNVVAGAASQNPSEMLAGSTRLKELLELPGTLNSLHQIAAETTFPLPIRQLSIIQIKNVVVNHWRSKRLIPEDERPGIRARCIGFLDEQDDTISRCNEVIVAKMARNDFPQKWPSLESDLMTPITTFLGARQVTLESDPRSCLILHRALRLLNAILKEFSGAKMMATMKILGELIARLHPALSNHYVKIAEGLATSLNAATLSHPRTAEDLLFAHLLFKIIMKMAVWVWPKLHDPKHEALAPWFTQAFQSSAVQLKSLYETRINLLNAVRLSNIRPDPVAARSLDLLTRYVRTLGKFFRRVQQLNVNQFVELPLCDDLVSYYWDKVVQANSTPDLIADSPEAVFPVRFLVQGMVLFKESLAQWSPSRKVKSASGSTLPKDFVENAVTFLVTRFMPLNPSDLEGWMNDPEEWVNGEDNDEAQWEFELRPCAERVLMTFTNQYSQYAIPLLVDAFNRVNAQPATDLQTVIQKEAIYTAVGRCASRLRDHVNFGQWLDLAAAEAKNPSPDYLIIKRRIAWLIGRWVSDGNLPPTDVRLWQILVHLLTDRGTGTEVVRLTTATAVRQCADSIHSDPDVFAPFLGPMISELLYLIGEVESVETKGKLATCLNTVLERSEGRVVPFVGLITNALPQLWVSTQEAQFKINLLQVTTTLISAIKEESTPLAAIVVPLIQESLSPAFSVQLDSDAIRLWTAALRNATTIEGLNGAAGLIDLFPLAISLLAQNLDLLGRITDVLESYFLLGPDLVLQRYAVPLFTAMLSPLKQAFPTNIKGLLLSLQILFQLAHPSGYAEALHHSGLFANLAKTLLDDKADVFILTHDALIMARIAVADRQNFLNLMAATAVAQNVPETRLWDGVLDQWWQRFDNLSEPRYRKLSAMGIASLVSSGRPEVLQRLHSEIFNIWTDVFVELKEVVERKSEDGLDDGSTAITLYWDQPSTSYFNGTEDTAEYTRRKSAYDNDPTRTTLLSAFIAARLQEAEVACGGTQVMESQYLYKTDPAVLKQIMTDVFGKR